MRNGDLVYGEICGARVEDLPACLLHHCRFEVIQLKDGESCCDLDFLAGSRAAICRQHIARPLHLRGTMIRGWMGLGLVHEGTNGDGVATRVRDDLLHLALPDAPFDWYLRGGQTLLLVMAEQEALLQVADEARVDARVRTSMAKGKRVARLRGDSLMAAEQRAALLDLLEDARRGDLEGNGPAFGRAVLDAMMIILDSAEDTGAGRGSSETLVHRAREVVGEVPRRFRIAELCGELRVSPRTLHKAFIDVTGVGPHAYFLRQRLNAARHQLAAADPLRETVTNIALGLGFTELGRFAGRYRTFFGENPSQTLQRSKRQIEPLPAAV